MSKLYCVSYELGYSHRVVVGIQADDDGKAIAKAQTAFDDGLIWDDTQDMPLLFDDYEETAGNCLVFEAEEVEAFPKPDLSVVIAKGREYALKACDALIAGDLDGARNWAGNVALARQEFRETSGQQQEGPAETLAVQDIEACATVHGGSALRCFDVHLYPVMRIKVEDIRASSPAEAIDLAEARFIGFNGLWPRGMEYSESFDGFVVDEKGEPDESGCVPLKSYCFEKDGVTPAGSEATTHNPLPQPARLVVSMEGGLVQAVFADTAQPLECAVFDLDTEGADADELAELGDGTVFIGHIEPCIYKEGFVDEVFKSVRH